MKFASISTTVALAAALTLSACSSPESADADGDGTITQDEVNAAVADVNINPGEWESTMEIVDVNFDEAAIPEEARGMIGPMIEQMKGEVQTSSSCITEEQASNPQGSMFAGQDEEACEYERFTFAGGKMDMAMTCTQEGAGTAKIVAEGNYTADEYDMEMSMEMSGSPMGEMTMSMKSSGKRTGECAAE